LLLATAAATRAAATVHASCERNIWPVGGAGLFAAYFRLSARLARGIHCERPKHSPSHRWIAGSDGTAALEPPRRPLALPDSEDTRARRRATCVKIFIPPFRFA
jgi:hypothetical protein